MLDFHRLCGLLALDEDLNLAVFDDRVVDLLALFQADIAMNSGATSIGLKTS